MDVKARVSSGDELLNEKFTIPSIITTPNPIDFNTFTTPGIYYVGAHSTAGGDSNFINNEQIKNWGTLIVSGKGGTLFQLFIEDSSAGIFHRHVDASIGGPNYVWRKWTTIYNETSTLDKAFPVGYSYLSVNVTAVPSFGTWTHEVCGFMSDKESTSSMFRNNIRVYLVTRTA